jgi:hypothetical protein
MGCPAYIVAFRWDLSDFWIYDLSGGAHGKWTHGTQKEYEGFIKRQIEERYRAYSQNRKEQAKKLGGALYRLSRLHDRISFIKLKFDEMKEAVSRKDKKAFNTAMEEAEPNFDVDSLTEGWVDG